MPDPAFKRFGKYEIQAELGRGGFGRVFRAFDPTVARLVAIKILTSEAGTDLLTRFHNEAMAAGNLRHENIVTIYEFGEEQDVPFIAMEYLEGEDLQQTITSRRALTLLDKVSIMSQVAAGLDCAHRHGVVHRDVKPANIRLLPDGRVKIMDFGIARLIREDGAARLTRQGHLLGTLLYMAPEQVMGSDTDFLCDVFAYGVTFYELLTGRHPFRADDPRTIFYKITSEDPELIHQFVPECPETLDGVIRRALHKERELRYQSLRDLRLDIEPVLMKLRGERATAMVQEARHLTVGGNAKRALSLLNEAIDLDSANQAARKLRDEVQTTLRRQLLRPRIEALIAKGSQSMAEGNYADAVQTFNAALRLDPDDEILQARSSEAQLKNDQSCKSVQLLTEARADLAFGNFEAAMRKASEAAALNPKSSGAKELVERAKIQIDKRDRQRQFNAELEFARKLVDDRRLAEAVQLLLRLRSDFSSEPGLDALLSRAQQELTQLEEVRARTEVTSEIARQAASDSNPAVTEDALICSPNAEEPLERQPANLLAGSFWRSWCFRRQSFVALGCLLIAATVATVYMLTLRKNVSMGKERSVPLHLLRTPVPASPPKIGARANAVQPSSSANPEGTLIIQANVDEAFVLIDGRRTKQMQSGHLAIPLQPRDYTIEVQKQGYKASPEHIRAKIRTNEQFRASFSLGPKPATLVLTGAPDGAVVLVDGSPAGTVHGGRLLSIVVSPGTHTVGLAKDGFTGSSTQSTLRPGETLDLNKTALRLEQIPQAAKPSPQQVAPQITPPASPSSSPALAHPDREENEATDWTAARSGTDRAAIQTFIQKYPNSARRAEALQLLAQLDWNALDRKDVSALERFAAEHSATPLAQQATLEIERMKREAAGIAKKKTDNQLTVDREEISRVLTVYAAAFDQKNLNLLKTIWPGLPETALARAFRGKGEIRSQLRPLAAAEVIDENATIRCSRVTDQITEFGRQKPVEETRTVHLHKENGRWVISAID
ncbi:MAG TPA: protein kinase [Bryobacteraceae bacterium]|nr:protein kinase [Bryobacteraceae bacterium]